MYQLTFEMIDGTWTKQFASLDEAAAEIQSHYLGSDYIRSGYLQTESGMIWLEGFGFSDLGGLVPKEWGSEFDWYGEYGGSYGQYKVVHFGDEDMDMMKTRGFRTLSGAIRSIEDYESCFGDIEIHYKDTPLLSFTPGEEPKFKPIKEFVSSEPSKEQPPF